MKIFALIIEKKTLAQICFIELKHIENIFKIARFNFLTDIVTTIAQHNSRKNIMS